MRDLLERNRLLETLVTVSRAIAEGVEREDLFRTVLAGVLSSVPCEGALLFAKEGHGFEKFWSRRDGRDRPGAMREETLSREGGITRRAIATGTTIQLDLASGDRDYDERIDGFEDLPDGSYLAVPLVSRERVSGALVARNRIGEPFDEIDRDFLTVLANELAIARESRRVHRKLERLVVTDELTKVYNYRFIKTALRKEVKRAQRFRQTFSVLMLDVDNLKEYNDRNGHIAGSQLLRALGKILLRESRAIDVVAKYGGDEFLIILPQTENGGATRLSARLHAAVSGHRFERAEPGQITVSIGIASYPVDGGSAEKLLASADRAMFAAKRAGKNRTVVA